MSQESYSLQSSYPLHEILLEKELATVDLIHGVQRLLESGHNPSKVDDKGQTAVHVCATVGGPVEVLRLLVDRTPDADALDKPDCASMTPLHCLLDEDRVVDPACLKCLVKAGASLTSWNAIRGTPLDCLSRHSDSDGVGDLFDCLRSVALDVLRREKESLLTNTLRQGSTAFLEVLLSKWNSLSDELWTNSFSTPVFDALSSSRDVEAKTKLVIDYGANPVVESWPEKETLAHRAAALGSIPLLDAAEARGVDLSSKDARGQTPLHIAVKSGSQRKTVVDSLIEYCVDLNEVDADGFTALEVAVSEPTRNLDVAASLVRAGAKLPTTEISYDVAVAVSAPNVIARSANPILTALEVSAFFERSSQYVAPSEKRLWVEVSDKLVNFARELAAVGSSDTVLTRAIPAALENNQKEFLLNSDVLLCLDRMFFSSSVRRRGLSGSRLATVARFLFDLLMLFVRFVAFPFVLLFFILPRYRSEYDVVAKEFILGQRRAGVVYYAAQGIGHFIFCILLFVGSGSSSTPSHYRDPHLSSVEWLLLIELVSKILYEVGQLRLQSARVYFAQIANSWDICIILSLIVVFALRFTLMSSSRASIGAESALSILFAFLFLAASFRVLFFMVLFPHFGPMVISFRRLFYPLVSFLLLFVVVLLAFGVAFKNIHGIEVFEVLCSENSPVNASNSSCLTISEAVRQQLPLGWQTLGSVLQVLFLSMVNLASPEQLGIAIRPFYTAEDVLTIIWAVVWLVLSSIILLNMLIAVISNAYQNSEDQAESQWVFLKAEIITELHHSPLAPSFLNLLYVFGVSVAYVISVVCGWRKEESSEKKMKIRREVRRSDLMVRGCLLANYKAAVEEKELDEPITKRDMDTLKAEMEKTFLSRQKGIFRESCHTESSHLSEEDLVIEWVSERLGSQLSSVLRRMKSNDSRLNVEGMRL